MPEVRLPEVSSETVHGACVAIGGQAVLIEGRSGEGKSDLALRLIDRGAVLVADSQVICQRQDGKLLASAPTHLAGRIEVRGLGIIEMPSVERIPVDLLIVILDAPPRFPEDTRTRRIAGVDVPVLALAALEPSAPIKVELAVKQATR
ncbi:serine kinase of HPr protein (carbohydrate metabolism regulator) [Sphingomonas naasensis]|uniref:Aldolase n=1 Tax=Sphingomonas naasensis TaxID=1344951 RepID=A0A4S1WM08_9SPHN|nr:HPr kinase/phosphatase C-terminal domain-containing protein [Sphingomonas naasensis]NIJ20150.1 serine kinase of HPr protein (carbohydrate metabolism regulator) [Sphingomonas naasensis]TGX44301.1 aldolase [Sphingomonas naasensis]